MHNYDSRDGSWNDADNVLLFLLPRRRRVENFLMTLPLLFANVFPISSNGTTGNSTIFDFEFPSPGYGQPWISLKDNSVVEPEEV
jgi:hypothetical protein